MCEEDRQVKERVHARENVGKKNKCLRLIREENEVLSEGEKRERMRS